MDATLLPLLLSLPADQRLSLLRTDATCGTSNGSFTLGAVTGGVAPYTYSVDGSPFTATLVYNNLAAGTYTIDVRDANGCNFATTLLSIIPADQQLSLLRLPMQPAVMPMDQSPLVPLPVVSLLILILSTDHHSLQHLFTITWLQVLIPLM